MKIAVINGSMRRGSTWNCTQSILKELSKIQETQVTEFFLPQDMPHFCAGCYSCFYKGENACPHARAVQPIAKALLEADLVVLTSPVYGFDVSGQMKAMLDHLCYLWMSHRPAPEMFHTLGLTVATTAGVGLRHTAKTMRNSLKYWGVKKSFAFGMPVSAMAWNDVSEKKKAAISKAAAKMAKQIARAYKNKEKLPNPLFRSFFMKIMSGMQKKNDWNKTDRAHWEAHGWLNGKVKF